VDALKNTANATRAAKRAHTNVDAKVAKTWYDLFLQSAKITVYNLVKFV
jgi:hypothetical protein